MFFFGLNECPFLLGKKPEVTSVRRQGKEEVAREGEIVILVIYCCVFTLFQITNKQKVQNQYSVSVFHFQVSWGTVCLGSPNCPCPPYPGTMAALTKVTAVAVD